MSRCQQQEVECPNCGHKQETTIWDSVNVTEDPELRDSLVKAELNMFCCEKCEFKGLVPAALLYHDMARKFCVQYYPPEALEDRGLYGNFTHEGKLNMKEVFGGMVAPALMSQSGYMAEPHVVFDMAEMQRYVFFRERLFRRHNPEIWICEALQVLLERGGDDSYVIIEEPQSEKFVQFGKGACLCMDVPCGSLSAEEADRASRFFKNLGEECPREYDAPNPKTKKIKHGATFSHDFGHDAEAATQAAITFFAEVYGFPAGIELSVEEH